MMIRMVGGWVFLLVPAHLGSHGQRAVKRLFMLLCACLAANFSSFVVRLLSGLDAFQRRDVLLISFTALTCWLTDTKGICHLIWNVLFGNQSRRKIKRVINLHSPEERPLEWMWWFGIRCSTCKGWDVRRVRCDTPGARELFWSYALSDSTINSHGRWWELNPCQPGESPLC